MDFTRSRIAGGNDAPRAGVHTHKSEVADPKTLQVRSRMDQAIFPKRLNTPHLNVGAKPSANFVQTQSLKPVGHGLQGGRTDDRGPRSIQVVGKTCGTVFDNGNIEREKVAQPIG